MSFILPMAKTYSGGTIMQSIIFKQFYQDSQQYELLLNEILNSTFDSEKGDGFHIIRKMVLLMKATLMNSFR